MGKTVTEKIIEERLVGGSLKRGAEIALKIDHALIQDATGTTVMLEFMAMDIPRVRTEHAAIFVDHNLLQTDFKNADDHRFLRTAAAKFGLVYSRPGNGISHQVHLERFSVPGKTLLGSDSHTPTNAGASMLAIGAGGLDVAMALAGHPFYLTMPEIVGVRLAGRLQPWVSAKDVVLELLRRYSVKGGLGKIYEYFGPGVETLSATDRGTMGNFGTELGLTSSMFPSDLRTREFLESQGREAVWKEISADPDARYDEIIEVDLSTLEPMIACPSSPDNVEKVADVEGTEVAQVIVGSSVNSSFRDLMVVARAVEGRHAHPDTSFEINPGSRQVLLNVERAGGVESLILAGARIHQSGCLGCIGMGQAPATGTVSLRTFPRNFPGRSGTKDDRVYLCSPETAVAAAVFGRITDPRRLGDCPNVVNPTSFYIHDDDLIYPPESGDDVEIVMGPNIHPLPKFDELDDELEAVAALKVGDNITTDHIMPAGAKILPFRSNIEALSEFVFSNTDEEFPSRCRSLGVCAVIGGENYGQGSSREHAAVASRYLGVRLKIAKSFARIHKANLINFGILPLTFANPVDYDKIAQDDRITAPNVREAVKEGKQDLIVKVRDEEIPVVLEASKREREILAVGGLINLAAQSANGS